jgi:hypothetical protein
MSILRLNMAVAGALLALALAPNPSRADDTATIICKDGTTSAHGGSGACSGHGGVDKNASKAVSSANASSAAANKSAAATGSVLCKDGTTSAHGGSGACSGHGGIDRSKTGSQTTTTGGTTAGATTPSGSTQGSTTRMAQAPRSEAAPGGGPGKVWVNTDSKVYHCPGDQWYGKTTKGEYMTESAAKAQGFRADHNKPCQ